MIDNQTKFCIGCRLARPFDAFSGNRAAKDGRQSKCRECTAAARRTAPPCTHGDCRKPIAVKERGLCAMHNKRFRLYGDADATPRLAKGVRRRDALNARALEILERHDPLRRMWEKVEKTDTCWLWTGTIKGNGYGKFTVGRKHYNAHRWVYEALVGAVPDGLQLDHLCRVRRCVNPEHLEPVTGAENTRRGPGSMTHCRRNHEFTQENTYIQPSTGRRTCKRCKYAAIARFDERRRSARTTTAVAA